MQNNWNTKGREMWSALPQLLTNIVQNALRKVARPNAVLAQRAERNNASLLFALHDVCSLCYSNPLSKWHTFAGLDSNKTITNAKSLIMLQSVDVVALPCLWRAVLPGCTQFLVSLVIWPWAGECLLLNHQFPVFASGTTWVHIDILFNMLGLRWVCAVLILADRRICFSLASTSIHHSSKHQPTRTWQSVW